MNKLLFKSEHLQYLFSFSKPIYPFGFLAEFFFLIRCTVSLCLKIFMDSISYLSETDVYISIHIFELFLWLSGSEYYAFSPGAGWGHSRPTQHNDRFSHTIIKPKVKIWVEIHPLTSFRRPPPTCTASWTHESLSHVAKMRRLTRGQMASATERTERRGNNTPETKGQSVWGREQPVLRNAAFALVRCPQCPVYTRQRLHRLRNAPDTPVMWN